MQSANEPSPGENVPLTTAAPEFDVHATSVRGKVALVTGGAGFGIGTTIAEHLAACGARVALDGRNGAALRDAVGSIGRPGRTIVPYPADVSRHDEVDSMVNHIRGDLGPIDILVNNAAGGARNRPVHEFPLESWDQDIATILTGGMLCCRAAARDMVARGSGRVLFIASSAALRGSWGRGVSYAAAKAGVVGLTKQLALELSSSGVTVNAICPSQIRTPRVMRGGRRTAESLARYAEQSVPLKRVGVPADVSGLAVFLASAQASYITGQVFSIDGGTSLAAPTTRTAGGA